MPRRASTRRSPTNGLPNIAATCWITAARSPIFSAAAITIWVIWLAVYTGVPAKPAANWLIRLQKLRGALPDLPADAATIAEAKALLTRLGTARQALSA